MAIVLAAPPPPPPPVQGVPWTGVTSTTWTANGVVIDLLDPSVDGVVVLRDGIRGLNMPPVDRFTSSSPVVPGTRHRGWQTRERPVFWPTLVWTREGSEAWQVNDQLLWESLRPDVVGEWEVVTDLTGPRRLACRYLGDGDHQFQRDPLRSGWVVYGLELVAEQPYWMGETVSETWYGASGQSRNFLPGPPFWIGSGATVDVAELVNPGQLPQYVVWTIQGPTPAAQVGFRYEYPTERDVVSLVEVPFAVGEGELLVIDSRPHMQTATLIGADGAETDRTGDLGETTFAPIPAGDQATLTLALAGSGGSITAELTPLYWRALS